MQIPDYTVTTAGRYTWHWDVQTPDGTEAITGSSFYVPQDASTFGPGWTLSNIDRLYVIPADPTHKLPAGILRSYGTGEWRFYTATAAAAYTSPAGDNGTLTNTPNGFNYTTPDGQCITFDNYGRETALIATDGYSSINYSYNSTDGTLRTITATDGSIITCTYQYADTAHKYWRVNQILGPNNRAVDFTWDPSGGLLEIDTLSNFNTNSISSKTQFGTGNDSRLSGETVGSYAKIGYTWGYDYSGLMNGYNSTGATNVKLISAQTPSSLPTFGPVSATSTDAMANVTTYVLDQQGRTLSQTLPDGGTTSYAYNNGFVETMTTPGGTASLKPLTTTYALDKDYYVTKAINPDKTSSAYTYQDEDNVITGLSQHLLNSSSDELQHTTYYGYDAAGHQTSLTNALGQTTLSTYDPTTGLLASVTDPIGNTVSYQYANRQVTATQDPYKTIRQFYDVNGNPSGTLNVQTGQTTGTVYNSLDQLISETDGANDTTTDAYDPSSGEILTTTDPNGTTDTDTYNTSGTGQVVSTKLPATSLQANVVAMRDDPDGRVNFSLNSAGYYTLTGYDSVGRVTQTTDAASQTITTLFNTAGQKILSSDRLGDQTSYLYNLRGRLTTTIDPMQAKSTIAYDLAGNQTLTIDPLGNPSYTQYDALNRPIVSTDANGHSTITKYDPAGNVTATVNPNGSITLFTYDALNRQVTKTSAAGTPLAETTTTTYDLNNNAVAVTDARGYTTSYAFDQANRVTRITDPYTYQESFQYDSNGNKTQVTDFNGNVTTYSYDDYGDVTGSTVIGNPNAPINEVTTMAYDVIGRNTLTIDPAGGISITKYDGDNRVTSTFQSNNTGTSITYDLAGNETNFQEYAGPGANGRTNYNTTTFTYDRDGRQVGSIDPLGKTTATTYDAAGRMTSFTDANGRVTTYQYDNVGNELAETWRVGNTIPNVQSFSYDADDNKLTASDGNGRIAYTYDSLDRVATRTDTFGVKLLYQYDKDNNVTSVTDNYGGSLTQQYNMSDDLSTESLSATGMPSAGVAMSYYANDNIKNIARFALPPDPRINPWEVRPTPMTTLTMSRASPLPVLPVPCPSTTTSTISTTG